MMATGSAQELAPDDPSISGNLGAWFRDAANDFDVETGIWTDASGNGRHAIPVGEVNVAAPITYVAPTLATISGGMLSPDAVPSLHFTGNVNDLLVVDGTNGGTPLSNLTIFVVYNVDTLAANTSQVRPVGIGSVAGTQQNPGNHFNLGSDPSIRKDNGQLGAGTYSQPFPARTTFIRTARMSPTAIDEWFNTDGTLQRVLNLTGSSFTTSTDNFFLGDVRAGAEGIPGVPGPSPAVADFDIVQAIVYNSALTDAQVTGVNEGLANNISGGGDGTKLAFTAIEVGGDGTSVTLTWHSKPGKTYAVDLSTDLSAAWHELNDEVPSEGADTTTTTVPTFTAPQPDPLPDRVFFRVREVPSFR